MRDCRQCLTLGAFVLVLMHRLFIRFGYETASFVDVT